ncbi:MAG: hypothetical protein LBS55_06105 [Prevotellaceae bacterium]|nr:hypothetical protein [Prevotellaceae bacterium]
MNGKAIYDDPSIAVYPYIGDPNAKRVVFIYKTNDTGCLKGKEYKMIIVIYDFRLLLISKGNRSSFI